MDLELPEILYQDDSLLAINKPAGLLSIRDGYQTDLLHVASLLTPLFGRLWIVHRLDRDTSGVMLLARSAEAHRSLNLQFEQRQTHKVYHALVAPCPDWESQVCELPLRVDGDRRHRTRVSATGKPARTDFNVLEHFSKGAALLAARPHTGYTHQIRAHLLALGFPLLGDSLYFLPSVPKTVALIARPALHSMELEVHHPLTGKLLRLHAPYPPDFHIALDELRNQ